MNQGEGNSQTTKGIWMTPKQAGSILVFDIEGADSGQRGKDREVSEMTWADFLQKAERMISLFGLVISDVLIINMWATDLGRHNASL